MLGWTVSVMFRGSDVSAICFNSFEILCPACSCFGEAAAIGERPGMVTHRLPFFIRFGFFKRDTGAARKTLHGCFSGYLTLTFRIFPSAFSTSRRNQPGPLATALDLAYSRAGIAS